MIGMGDLLRALDEVHPSTAERLATSTVVHYGEDDGPHLELTAYLKKTRRR
jgi:hypothetical protein